MTDHVVVKDWPDCIAFDRLHALTTRGYKAALGAMKSRDGFSSIELSHVKVKSRKTLPPPVTLWSNGIVSTNRVLWPEKYVAQEEGPPDWQRYIDTSDSEGFAGFLQSVPLPTLIDRFAYPFLCQARAFAARLTFGATLCVLLGIGIKLCSAPILGSVA